MTYKESYLMCKSADEIMKSAMDDIWVAKMIGSSARIAKIKESAEEAISEKFPDHIADISREEQV